MANDNSVTIIGNVTRDPELRFTNTGRALAEFGVAVNNRRRNPQTNEWEDGDPQFFDVTCWAQLAENVSESVSKGTRVIVAGRLNFRQWETDQGEKRSRVSLIADEVGPSLRWANAEVSRNERRDGAGGGNAGGGGGNAAPPAATPPAGYDYDEEPF